MTLRLAFADPPYLGCCGLYGHNHGEVVTADQDGLSGGCKAAVGRCWDDPDTHHRLLQYLAAEFDGWAYCMSSPTLPDLYVPGARIAAWVKPFAAYKANVRIAYTWEPVLFVPGRDRSADGAPVGRDHLAEPITLQRGLTGAKPERFCRWVCDLLGYVDGDELIDLFPSTGVMGKVLAQGRLAI